MSLYESAVNPLLDSQEIVFSDDIFLQDEDGQFTVPFKGIFKSQGLLVDSITQQQFFSQNPMMWIRSKLPEGITIKQGSIIEHNDKYYTVKEIQDDVDKSCMNLVLYETQSP